MLFTAEKISINNYWQQGIDHILRGQDEEAQAIWLLPFFDNDLSINEAELSQSLTDYLSDEVERTLIAEEISQAYKLVKHLCVIDPGNTNTLLRFLSVSIRANEFIPEILADSKLFEAFNQASSVDIDLDILEVFITNMSSLIKKQDNTTYINFLKLIISKVKDIRRLVCILYLQADRLGREYHCIQSNILEICLEYAPSDMRFDILSDLADINIMSQNLAKAISISEQCNYEGELAGGTKHLFSSHQLLSALMEAGEWNKIPNAAKYHQEVVQNFIEKKQHADITANSILTTFFLNYLNDEPRISHSIRNAIGEICSKAINSSNKEIELNYHNEFVAKNSRLRIGYIGSTLYKHSVGWLSRWLFHYHNRSNFEIFIYHVDQYENDSFNHKFFRDKVDKSYYLYGNAEEISEEVANLIRQDKIDILIDLDSIGSTITYSILCFKPAPISVTWLGWDASGCPAVDYFMADPYVLPSDADEYYRSKIWRLPHTYVAIDGFEVEVPTKRRSDYQLPNDAIVYLCAQKSYKHHPDILRLQMQIIQQVPNSYLMVQLRSRMGALMHFYQELAAEVGISMDQLRFIHLDPDEMTHRANLQLADVVLDTFPYNGATTTLETLWMGVPLVTKVGQAFVARNSYTFMQNVGVTEGIAHTDAEYVDWGVRLGTNLALRQQVMGKLLHSRKTSPLWNARSFTLEMEQAYLQMWEIYQSQKK
jgi:predicted O-linked N-acetylglucosamine transferase (SPINDLY family)